QGANLISNVPHNLTESGRTIAMTIRHAIDHGHDEIEVTQEAQDAWVELLLSGVGGFIGASPDCTPGYYNNEGQPRRKGAELYVGHPQGAMAYFAHIKRWRESGEFAGLAFR
nr:monooxygenase [Gammaproteobacteria bacterium]